MFGGKFESTDSDSGQTVANFNAFEYQTTGSRARDTCEDGKEKPVLLGKSAVIEQARKMFDVWDKNKNGVLTYDELVSEIENKNNKAETAQVLAALYGTRKTLQDMNRDAGFLNKEFGISKGDLDVAGKVIEWKAKQTNNPYSLEGVKALDRDHDGYICRNELEIASRDRTLPKKERELIDFYIKNDDNRDLVSTTDMLTYFTKNDMGDRADKFLNRMDMILARTHDMQTRGTNDLFADQNPDIYGVAQGVLGDCYFMASLAAVAHNYPEIIKNMIRDNPDGTYTVTFPGAKDEPITIDPPTESERGLFAGAADHGKWAPIIEKAYGTFCQKQFYRRTILNMSGGNLPSEGADGGGVNLGHLLHILTGKSTDQDWLAIPVSVLQRIPPGPVSEIITKAKLDASVGTDRIEKTPVVAWQKPGVSTSVSDVTNHVYSVLEFDRTAKDGGSVTLYNPWGHKETISFTQFKKRFHVVAYVKPDKKN